MIEALHLARAAFGAWRGEAVRLPGMTLQVPATVVDVGANIGYNTARGAVDGWTDVVKLDVEGAEPDMLASRSSSSLRS